VNQKLFQAKVYVSLKKGLADPQGSTIKEALESLGYRNLSEVRFGKYIEVRLGAKSKEEGEQKLREMCGKLLVNPIIEEYSYHIEEEG
jgi:phosphoribosylformylglycinamidine synthase